jgi:glycosyltransferase involved in cell wall biosynthesis
MPIWSFVRRPLVSVLIPTFNRSTMLTQAVRSAQEQTYRNLEIVVAVVAARQVGWV